jgi:flagellar hook assembly protein FlgD
MKEKMKCARTATPHLPAFSGAKLTIYNVLGQKIKTLIDSFQNAGEHSLVWDATDEKNNPVSSGVYFYKLETNDRTFQKKMVLVR